MHSKRAVFYLLIVAALWGLTFPLIEGAVASVDPITFVTVRFTIAALPLLPYFFAKVTRKTLYVGTVLGVMHLGAFIFQTVGLTTVNASRAAFLTGTYVIMIPFLSPLMRMGTPKTHDIISAFICCCGIFILTGCNIGSFSYGDYWIVLGSLFVALTVVYIGKHAQEKMDPLMLAFGQIIMTGLFSWIPFLFFTDRDFTPFGQPALLAGMAVCSILCTIVAIILQSKYQGYVSIQNTALIFSLEPFFASLFDTLLTLTPPTIQTLSGGGVIVLSILYLELFRPRNMTAPAES